MNLWRTNDGEEGTSVLEFVLVLPMLVLAIYLFLGFGQTLILKQEGLVAARYAAFYRRASGVEATADAISKAVSPQGERWEVQAGQPISTGPSANQIQTNEGSLAGFVSGIFSSLLASLDNAVNRDLQFHVSTTPNRGLLARMMGPSTVQADYALANDTWTGSNLMNYIKQLPGAISTFIEGLWGFDE